MNMTRKKLKIRKSMGCPYCKDGTQVRPIKEYEDRFKLMREQGFTHKCPRCTMFVKAAEVI
jgi:hypothetical protein